MVEAGASRGEATRAQVGGLVTGSQTYDLHYRPGTLADGKRQASAFAWDKAGNLTALRYPGGGQMRFPAYDREGNLTLRVSGRQIRTRYVLAPDDSRLTDVLYGSPWYGTPDVHCEYDEYGRLTKAESRYPGAPVAEATLEYEYDDNDTVTKVSTSYADQFYATNDLYGPYDVSYTFFPDGSRASMGTPYGTYGYQYDAGGRSARVTFPWTNGYAEYTYLANDWLQREDSAGLRTSYVWNARGFLTSLTHTGPSGSPTFSSFTGMTYNAVGQRTHTDITIPAFSGTFTSYPSASGTVDYEYDAQGRLTREHSVRDNTGVYGATFDRRYAWDGADNPTTLRNLSRSYNRDNQLVYAGRSYDGDGNTLVSGASYDAENRLLSTTLSGGNWWCGYRPDGLCGWRISGSLGGVYVVYDGAQPLYEVDLDGIVRWVYGWGASGLRQVSRADDEAFTYNLLFDPQGNLVQREPLYDETPAHPAEAWVYDAFGAWVAGTTAGVRDFEPMGFGGQFGCYADSDGLGWTGLVSMTHRFYEPWSARFFTRDPIGYEGGLNLYTYCGGDPVNNADPSGLQLQLGRPVLLVPSDGTMREAGRIARRWASAAGSAISTGLSRAGRWIFNRAIRLGGTVKMDPNAKTLQSAYRDPGTPETGLVNGRYPVAGHAIRNYIDETGGQICIAVGASVAGRFFVSQEGFLTNGVYRVDAKAMAVHVSGRAAAAAKTQFLFSIDADSLVLRAAEFADKHGLWRKVGSAEHATVEFQGPVGVLGDSGELTNFVTITRTRTRMLHGWPSVE